MMTLRTLDKQVLRSLTRAFQHGVESCYQQLFDTRCAKVLSFCRDLCFLPHLLEVRGSWKEIRVCDLANRCQLPPTIFTSTVNAVSLATILADNMDFQHLCHALLQYRLQVKQNLFVSLKRLVTWNIGGGAVHRLQEGTKFRNIRRLSNTGIVCLQETRWTDAGASALQQRLTGTRVLHSPAKVTPEGYLSGGVAMLIPLGFSVTSHVTIVEGRLHAVRLDTRTSSFWIINCYFHPQEKRIVLQSLVDWISNEPATASESLICGDFNGVEMVCSDLWNTLISLAELHELTGSRATYHHGDTHSPLDKVLGPVHLFANNQLSYIVYAESHWHHAGHDTIKIHFRPRAAIVSNPAYGWHHTIPTSKFKLSQETSDYRQMNADLADLMMAIERTPGHTFAILQSIIWSWWHSLSPTSSRTIEHSYQLLRKKAGAVEPLVWVPLQQLNSLRNQLPGFKELMPHHFPCTATHCHVPSLLLRRCFEIVDLKEAQQTSLELNRAASDKIRGLNTTSVFWQRMRTLCPRTVFYPGPVLQQNGNECRTDLDLDEAMLSTRAFWFEDPIEYDTAWTPTLCRYQQLTAYWPQVSMPEQQHYVSAILSSKDSAPGPDGIPYAAWRVHVASSAKAMVSFMNTIQDNTAPSPVSVGVWIPKAKLGPTANYFRPLGMPSTFERVIDCTATVVLVKVIAPYLHSSQTVLNEFREPQGAVWAIQDILDSPQASLALSLDLSKAFERINPYWLLYVLRIRGAPAWAVRYARFVLFGRSIRHKVRGRLLPPRYIKTGVDMGRAFSVLLFCIGMDPILTVLNDIPRVLAVRGYIDDTTLAGDAANPSWCSKAWSMLMSLHSAGIVIEQHHCWRAADVRMHPTDGIIDVPVHLQSALQARPGYHTAREAILAHCSYQHSLLVCRDTKCIVVTPAEARSLIHGQSNALFPLYSLQCTCNTKTALLTNCTWQEPLACALDTAQVGAHLLCDTTPALGLQLTGFYHLQSGSWRKVQSNVTALSNVKAMHKIRDRMKLFHHPANSVISKSIAFSMYIFSTVPYYASYHGFTAKDVQQLQGYAQKLILGRPWIKKTMLPHVFRWLKVAPLCDPAISLTLAVIGLHLRMGGVGWHLLPAARNLEGRQMRILQEIWQPWHRFIPLRQISPLLTAFDQATVDRSKAIKKLLTQLKLVMLRTVEPLAISYVATRMTQTGWPGTIPFELIDKIAKAPKRLVNGIARFALLRWAFGEDDDLGLVLRVRTGHQGTRKCHSCSSSTRTYPCGIYSHPLCEICIAAAQLTPFSIYSFEDLDLHPHSHEYSTIRKWPWCLPHHRISLPPLPDEELLQDIKDERCVACGKGDNSIGHWMRWCPVPLIVGKVILEDSHSATLQELSGRNLTAAVTVTHIIHQMRRLLIDFGGFQHASATQRKLVNWIQDLGSAVTLQLHPTLQVHRWPVGVNPLNETGCKEHLDGLEFTAPLPLQITSATNQDLAGIAKATVQPGDEIGVLPVGHAGLHILQQSHPTFYHTRILPPSNAELCMLDCSCDIPHVSIRATNVIAEGSEVIVSEFQRQNTIGYLLQFDGSYKSGTTAGGAGYCIYRVLPGQIQFLLGRSIALAECADNLDAEARAVHYGIDTLADLLSEEYSVSQLWALPIYVQGDIQPILRALAHHGRIKRQDIVTVLTDTQIIVAQLFRCLRWQFLPREANFIADHYAGVAMRFAYRHFHATPLTNDVQVKTDLPYALLYRAGARIFGRNVHTSNSIQIFQEYPNCPPQLVERYLTLFPQHTQAVHRYLAHGGQFEAPQTITYAASSFDNAGRLYATTEGSQRLPRQLRLLLFGSSHVEIDMVGAFYEIVRRTMMRDFPAGMPLPPIHQLRASIDSCLPPILLQREQLIKRLPSIVINLPHEQFSEWMESHAVSIALMPLRATFRALRDQAESIASTYSRTLRDGRYGGRGQIFRALECIELRLTLRLIDLLTQHSKITSVIWLHDGIWIAPPPPTRLVQVVDQLICQEFGINTGQPIFSLKDLQQTYTALVNQLPSRRQKLPARGKTPLLGSLLPTIVITRTASRQTRREACTFYSRMEGL